jgi:glycosyltransferase involved in cell wall biosynthesis
MIDMVTVVITCFNYGMHLEAAIKSVLAQTYASIELIIVDDGSNDSTASVCRRYPQARYIYQCNAGLSAARNTGLAAARGQLITFLDADDILLPGAIAIGVKMLSEHPEWAFVYGGYLDVSEDRASIIRIHTNPEEACYRALLQRNTIGMHATVLFRRTLLAEAGGFDTRLAACEDYDVYLRLTHRYPIGCYDTVVAEYRHHGGNMSRNLKLMLRTSIGVLRAQEDLSRYIPEYKAALRKGLAHHELIYGSELLEQSLKGLIVTGSRRQAFEQIQLVRKIAPRAFLFAAASAGRRVLLSAERLLPTYMRATLRQAIGRAPPPIKPGHVRFGDLRRLTPLNPHPTHNRGTPIESVYIDDFLSNQAQVIAGCVLEVGGNNYAERFGGECVTLRDVLHVSTDAFCAATGGKLPNVEHIPPASFDCIIFPHILHLIFDMPRACCC